MKTITCPGCGIKLPSDNLEFDKDFNASIPCRKLCYELSYYTLGLQEKEFIHQLVVDTYAAQHYRENMKPITITFALVGLYLVNEKNFTGKQVQNVHISLAQKNLSKEWPNFLSRSTHTVITVKDIVESSDDVKKDMIKKWCNQVWKNWNSESALISQLLNGYLQIN
jgi:hypothetical protein